MFTQTSVASSVFCCHRNAYISNSINKDEKNLINKHAEDERLFKVDTLILISLKLSFVQFVESDRLATKTDSNLLLSPLGEPFV